MKFKFSLASVIIITSMLLVSCGVDSNTNAEKVIYNRYRIKTSVISAEEHIVEPTEGAGGTLFHMKVEENGKSFPFDFYMKSKTLGDHTVYSYDYDTFEQAMFSRAASRAMQNNKFSTLKEVDNQIKFVIESPEDLASIRTDIASLWEIFRQDTEMQRMTILPIPITTAQEECRLMFSPDIQWNKLYSAQDMIDSIMNTIRTEYYVTAFNFNLPGVESLDPGLDKDKYVFSQNNSVYQVDVIKDTGFPLARVPEIMEALDIEYTGDFHKFYFKTNGIDVMAGTDLMVPYVGYYSVFYSDAIKNLNSDNQELQAFFNQDRVTYASPLPVVFVEDMLSIFTPDAEITCNGELIKH